MSFDGDVWLRTMRDTASLMIWEESDIRVCGCDPNKWSRAAISAEFIMSLKKMCGLLAFAVITGGSWMASHASAAPANVPAVNVYFDGDWVAPITGQTSYTDDGTDFSGNGWKAGSFSWSFSGDTDPLINWSFSASAPGTYMVVFSSPVSGGPYTVLKNQAALAVSDIGLGSNSTSVTGVSIDGQVPTGTSIPAVMLTGDLTVPNGATGHLTYGPLTALGAYGSPVNFSEVLNFTLKSDDSDGSAAFSGQLILTPEPTSLGLLGFGVAGLLMKRKR